METSQKTLIKFPQSADVRLWWGSFEVSDAKGSGDSLNVSVPQAALKAAVRTWLTTSCDRKDWEAIIQELTAEMREQDAKAAKEAKEAQ